MRFLLFLFSSAVVLSAQALTAVDTANAAAQKPKARLEGHVLNASTGEALRKANLHLFMIQSLSAGPAPQPMPQFVVSSDAEGKFAFEDLEPGRYTLNADRTGFVRQSYGARGPNSAGTNLTLDSGQEIKDVVFKLVPQGTISGRVVDEDGDPVEGAWVAIYRYSYVRGHRELQISGTANTQADGAFLIAHLATGRYYLSVDDRRNMNGSQWERYGGKGPEMGYATTFFPNSSDAASAAPVDVSAGSDVRGVEIQLRKSPLFHISGKLAGTTSQSMWLNLSEKIEGRTAWSPPRNATVRRDGLFSFNHAAPGNYIIEGQMISNQGFATSPPQIVHLAITVTDHNIDNLVISPVAGPEVSGNVKVEGWDSLQPPQSPQASASPPAGAPTSVQLVSASGESRFGVPFQNVNDDGTFQLRGIRPDKYRVQVNNLPDGTYVKSIHFAGEEVIKTGLDLSSGSGGQIEIILSPNAADVAGVVHKENGDAATGVRVTIWSPNDPDLLKTANTDQNGAFKIRNLGPGEYRIAAWEDVEFGLLQDPDFRARFDGKATTLKLAENAHETPEVKLIAKEESDAEAEKVK